jgi:hypothetical protein
MAEIKIEKKKTIWPWIILGILLLLAVFYFTSKETAVIEENEPVEEVYQEPIEEVENEEYVAASEAALIEYSDYIGNTGKMGIDHEYSNGALMYLINAVEAKANELNIDIEADLEEARKNAEIITDEPESLNHANLIKDSGMIISRALTTIQKSEYPNLTTEASDVEMAVSKIKKDEQTLNQKDDVNRFFKSAETLLEKMN